MLKGSGLFGPLIANGALNPVVQTTGVKVGLKLSINGLRILLIEPLAEFIPLLRYERVNRALNLLYRI